MREKELVVKLNFKPNQSTRIDTATYSRIAKKETKGLSYMTFFKAEFEQLMTKLYVQSHDIYAKFSS